MSENNSIEIPNMPDSNCFACGPINGKGLGMKFFKNDSIVYCNISIPAYMAGWNSVVHGGILSTLLDETMGWGAIVLLKKYIFTKSMTVNYHKPVLVMDTLRVESEVKERINEREAVMTARVYNSKSELCVSSTGVFSLMEKDYITKLAIVEEKQINFFSELFESFEKEQK